MSDLQSLTDDELQATFNDVFNEKQRRERLAAIPVQMAGLAKRFADDGGDMAVIQAAVIPDPSVSSTPTSTPITTTPATTATVTPTPITTTPNG